MASANVIYIAEICHAAYKAICDIRGDYSYKTWYHESQKTRDAVISDVEYVLANPVAPHEHRHDRWYDAMKREGRILLTPEPTFEDRLKYDLFRAIAITSASF